MTMSSKFALQWFTLALSCQLQLLCCAGWTDSRIRTNGLTRLLFLRSTSSSPDVLLTPKESFSTTKSKFLRSLDRLDHMNSHNLERSQLLEQLIASKLEIPVEEILENSGKAEHRTADYSIENPGRWGNMQKVAAGDWKVIYAPHMTTMARIFN